MTQTHMYPILRPLAISAAAMGAMFFLPAADARPEPPVVTPAPAAAAPLAPPSDAIILIDGTNLDEWTTLDGKPAGWKPEGVKGGGVTVEPGTGNIVSKRTFGDCQIHVEFATPREVEGDSQGRGNSGVYIQGRYELQILDSYKNSTYPDGQCGSIYKQHIPLANASRGPGEWQTYDIIFRAAKYDAAGKKTSNARVTAIHNGVLVQDNVECAGPTGGQHLEENASPGPIMLQEHGNKGRFRNVWVRKLE